VVALHAANGMLDKDTDTTQGSIGSFLLIVQLRIGVLLTLARLLRWDVAPIAMVVRLNAEISEMHTTIDIGIPIPFRWTLVLQHDVVVMVPTKGATKKNNQLVRQRHDRV